MHRSRYLDIHPLAYGVGNGPRAWSSVDPALREFSEIERENKASALCLQPSKREHRWLSKAMPSVRTRTYFEYRKNAMQF